MARKCLFILLGDCFREGKNASRHKDTQYGYDKQNEASISHNNLINKLNKSNYFVDIAINTYNTKYQTELISWYKNVVYQKFTNEDYGYFRNAVDKSLQNVINAINISIYNFIFICRLDLLLKNKLVEIFNPKWSCIIYPFAVYMEKENNSLIFPFVTDTMCFIPSKYFEKLKSYTSYLLHHHCWKDLINNGLILDDLDVMINTIHNPNTDTEINPLYKINCRQESNESFSKDIIYNKKKNALENINSINITHDNHVDNPPDNPTDNPPDNPPDNPVDNKPKNIILNRNSLLLRKYKIRNRMVR